MPRQHETNRSVVVAIDFSDASVHALDVALRGLGDRPDDRLHILHVIDDPGGVTSTTRLRNEAALLAMLPQRLRRIVRERADLLGVVVPVGHLGIHVRVGGAVSTILGLAADVNADRIVLGTHGRRGIARLMMGSVAEGVLRRAPCPVLVARPRDYSGLEPTKGSAAECPDCVVRRHRTDGVEWWCELHDREHEPPHTYSPSGPRWTHGMADFHGFGST